eukprot:CAMPEP_0114488228 /NCGR_PEP_ID=MMETSP0109-20121206/1208_1 /TAXON_ID=29199 /ORGANISM="Chlorarachnion reptans, Strain CCCM449" /LENGTH=359 /DNA_ID=CAMNT_0001664587 /DNA_START=7 /DNA_END=1086 /DNA_ORIENTATION=-
MNSSKDLADLTINSQDAAILMLTVSLLVCAWCVYSLLVSSQQYARVKLAATTQRTFVGLTLGSALCSVVTNVLTLSGEDREVWIDFANRVRVIMDLWCNTYLMIFWLKVHFFVKYRSETTLTTLWWAWAVSNVTFMVFKLTISALSISAYIEDTQTSYYRMDITVNVIVYILVPLLVAVFGYQLRALFKRWGREFSPSLSATLKRIAMGTIVVCGCFLLRAIILIMVLADVFSGSVTNGIYLFYYLGLTAIPQIIALYVMAILLPRQRDPGVLQPMSDPIEKEEKDGDQSRASNEGYVVANDEYGFADQHSPHYGTNTGAFEDRGENIFTEEEVWRTWGMQHHITRGESMPDEADLVEG